MATVNWRRCPPLGDVDARAGGAGASRSVTRGPRRRRRCPRLRARSARGRIARGRRPARGAPRERVGARAGARLVSGMTAPDGEQRAAAALAAAGIEFRVTRHGRVSSLEEAGPSWSPMRCATASPASSDSAWRSNRMARFAERSRTRARGTRSRGRSMRSTAHGWDFHIVDVIACEWEAVTPDDSTLVRFVLALLVGRPATSRPGGRRTPRCGRLRGPSLDHGPGLGRLDHGLDIGHVVAEDDEEPSRPSGLVRTPPSGESRTFSRHSGSAHSQK